MNGSQKRMRLLCVIDSLGSGGAQRQITAVARNMKALGWEVAVAWYTDSDFYRAALEKENILLFQDANATSFWKRLSFLRRTIRQFQPDRVLAFLPMPSVFCSLLKILSFSQWKLTISIRGSNEKRFQWMRKRFYRLAYTAAETVVCNSHAEADVWKRHAPRFLPKIKVIPNFVQIPESNVVYVPWKNGKLHILIAANLCSDLKNPKNVVKALSLLSKEERDRIVIDWYGNRLQNGQPSTVSRAVDGLVDELGLQHSFYAHDATYSIYDEMAKADFIALFSTEEGLPNVICEGMLLRKPVMMTKVSDWKLLVQENGYVCGGTDAESITQTLRLALNLSPEEMLIMGRKSRERGVSLFESKKTSVAWQSVLQCRSSDQ